VYLLECEEVLDWHLPLEDALLACLEVLACIALELELGDVATDIFRQRRGRRGGGGGRGRADKVGADRQHAHRVPVEETSRVAGGSGCPEATSTAR